jgi:cytochrome c-type biogenesis protein CcmH
MKKWFPWLLLGGVVIVALAIGAGGGGGHQSPARRTDRIARQVRCPTCRDLSAAESDAAAAKAVRTEIRRRVDAGQSDAQIKGFLASRYGRDILLTPDSGGVSALVWVLPVVALVAGAGFLGVAFWRWRSA